MKNKQKAIENIRVLLGLKKENNYFVADKNGNVAGHDLDFDHADLLCQKMQNKEPDSEWEILTDDNN